ncbi:MAG: hypothetical protein KF812_11195 [Fimbriimonadaceae bacterium]|nr:hypothetical protein [Fimbriimonadaceae bacterium]
MPDLLLNEEPEEHQPNAKLQQPEDVELTSEESDEFALEDEVLYLEERSTLLKRRDELGDIFDKGRVALAGGAIALTVTISKELVKSMVLWERIVLAGGWAVLAASLICAVLAVHRAGLAYDRQVDILDADRTASIEKWKKGLRDRTNAHAKLLERLNRASLWFLAIGLVVTGVGLFSAFAADPKTPDTTTPTVKIELLPTGEMKMSNSDNKPNTSGTSHEQKSFGPKDRPVTPKPSSGSGGNNQQNQGGGGAKK